MTKNRNRSWTNDEKGLLYSLREDGIPYSIIAVELKRSIRSCEAKYNSTNWVQTDFYDPVKGKMKEKMKQAYAEKTIRAQEYRRNSKHMIGDIIADRIEQAVSSLPRVPKPVYRRSRSKKKEGNI